LREAAPVLAKKINTTEERLECDLQKEEIGGSSGREDHRVTKYLRQEKKLLQGEATSQKRGKKRKGMLQRKGRRHSPLGG